MREEPVKRTTCVIVGLGRIGQELLQGLSRDLDLICIDRDPETEAAARALRGERLRFVEGDATSRLVLEDAGVNQADVVVLTPTSERITLEVARVLHEHFSVPRVLAAGVTPSGIETLGQLGVEVEGLFALSANALRNRIERRSRTAHGIGLGRQEILEVEVHPHSRLANKPLGSLTPRHWNVGIVYRDGNIVVPRGDTRLKGGDQVILLGEPGVLRTVVEILTLSFERFPLEYGSGLTAYLTGVEDQAFFAELAYTRDVFPLEQTSLLLSPSAERRAGELEALWTEAGFGQEIEVASVGGAPLDAIVGYVSDENARRGLVVLSRDAVMERAPSFRFRYPRKRFLRTLGEAVLSPVLLAAGTHPYTRLAVPGVAGVDLEHVLEAVFEMAPSLNQESAVLLVRPSPHLSTEEDDARYEEMRATISDMSLVYRASVAPIVLEGNPVTAVTGALGAHSLLVVDTAGWKRLGWPGSFLDPDVVWHVVRRSPVSTLLVPPEEEAL